MEASPLTQQSRPDTFKPKIVQLYEDLFRTQDYAEPSEGFWREFFLLAPDRGQLHLILDQLSPDVTLNLQLQTQQLFSRAIREAASGVSPTDAFALETLTVFLACVLKKKYTNPSSDVITVLAGLDEVDRVISDFVSMLDGIIRNGSSFYLTCHQSTSGRKPFEPPWQWSAGHTRRASCRTLHIETSFPLL